MPEFEFSNEPTIVTMFSMETGKEIMTFEAKDIRVNTIGPAEVARYIGKLKDEREHVRISSDGVAENNDSIRDICADIKKHQYELPKNVVYYIDYTLYWLNRRNDPDSSFIKRCSYASLVCRGIDMLIDELTQYLHSISNVKYIDPLI